MPLERYRARRDFGATPEPAPAPAAGRRELTAPGGCGRFVVHMHRARRLHWDLRLEMDGVLASWAVPRGPSLDPDVKRAAIRTEDHPLDYLDFEGVIPAGQYGAGDSTCWDWGIFEPETTWDPGAAVRDGELKFRLRGEKLGGRFTIVRTGGSQDDWRRPKRRAETTRRDDDDEGAGEAWLLIAKRGGDTTEAGDPVAGWDPTDHPASVKSGRTSEEVAAGMPPRFEHPAPVPLPTLDLPGSVVRAQPSSLAPMLATPGSAPFDGDDWLFEPKWDGYRTLAVVTGGRVRLLTRNGGDAGRYFPELSGPPAWLMAPEAIVDGEVVALDPDGRPDFSLLQGRLGAGFGPGDGPGPEARAAGRSAPLVFMAFDLPWCAGRSLLDVPLEDRKALLRLVLRESPRVRFGGHVARDGIAFFTAAAVRGLEGAMAKHRRSRYEPGRRSSAWLKLKIRPTQELIVGGWAPGEGSHRDLGAVLVGVMDGGRLRFAGRVGSGISAAMRGRLRRELDARARSTPPFAEPQGGLSDSGRGPDLHWVEPVIVIRAEIGGWTRDGLVRQATFIELAPDVEPATVERQDAVGPAAAERALAKAGRATRDAAAPATAPATAHVAAPAVVQPTRTPAATPTRPVPAPALEPSVIAPVETGELAALAALPPTGGTWQIGGRAVALTNLDKPMAASAPDDGQPPLTKRDLVRYMAEIGPVLLPHLANRALNLQRFPDGVDRPGFWAKNLPAGTPAWVERWSEPSPSHRTANVHALAPGIASLAWLGNLAAIEVHPWTSFVTAPFEPRWALVDIDPGERTTWDETLAIARLFRRAFDHLGVVGAPKVTGKRGIQVFVPIRAGYTFEETRAWVEQVSRAVGAAVPDLVSWEWSKGRRDGRARLDFTQNWGNRTLVAPYSPRPAPGLPVSAPITWDELDDPELRPDRWTIRTILPRVAALGDLFAAALGPGQDLPRL